MKESCREGLANHPDPESCVASRKAAMEALTGAPAGRVLSCEIFAFGVPTPFDKAKIGETTCQHGNRQKNDNPQFIRQIGFFAQLIFTIYRRVGAQAQGRVGE